MTAVRARSWDARDWIDGCTGALGVAVVAGAVQADAPWVPAAIVLGLSAAAYALTGLLRAGGPVRNPTGPHGRGPSDPWNMLGCLMALLGLALLASLWWVPYDLVVPALWTAMLWMFLGLTLVIVP